VKSFEDSKRLAAIHQELILSDWHRKSINRAKELLSDLRQLTLPGFLKQESDIDDVHKTLDRMIQDLEAIKHQIDSE